MTLKASELTFGIEIECYIPEQHRETFKVGAYHHGLQIELAPAGWNGQSDGSLRSGCPAGHFLVEVVSPILTGEDGLIEAVYMVQLLNECEAKVNGNCGFHIHIGAGQFSGQQIDEIRSQFVLYEMAFYGLSGEKMPSRLNSCYCKPAALWDASLTRQDRYRSLNLTNLGRSGKNTIEIRVWASTLKDDEVVGAISMALALVVKAINEGTEPGEPIVSPTVAGRQFAASHFTRPECWLVEPENLNEEYNDMANWIAEKCRKADRALRQLARA